MKKKKKVEKFEKWANRVLSQLRKDFYVQEYEWRLSIHKEEDATSPGCAAKIEIDVKYLSYHIHIYPLTKQRYTRGNHRGALDVLVHEMSHLYTEPLYLFAIDACTNTNKEYLETIREQQTQRTAGCIQELLDYKKYKPIIK